MPGDRARMFAMEEVEVKALPPELLASILTTQRARRLAESGGAGAGGVRGPHDLACQRDGPWWWRRGDAPDPAGVRAGGADRQPLARARRRAGVLRHHEAAAQPVAWRPGRRRSARRRRARLLRAGRRRQRRRDAHPDRRPRHRACCTTRRPQAWSTASGRPASGSCGAVTSGATRATTRPTRRGRSCGPTSNGPTPSCSHGRSTCRTGSSGSGSSSSRRRSTRSRPRTANSIRRRSAQSSPPSGLLTGADPAGPIHFERRDGTQGTVRQPHRPHRRRCAATPRRAARRAGQPLGPAQGHGRRARRVSSRWPPTVPTTPTSCSSDRTCPG